MRSYVSILFILFNISLFGQFSPIINFPINTFQYKGDTILLDNGQSVSFDLNVYLSIPENPVGIIYFFHGSGGSGRTWLLHVERPYLLAEAYYSGFGIITMDSNNRETKKWDFAVDNDGNMVSQNDSHDTNHVWMVHKSLTDNNIYSIDLPIFAVGFSNGGGFVSRLALRASSFYINNEPTFEDVNNIVPFSAAAVYGALGGRARFPQYDLPTIFNVGINDQLIPAYPDMTWHPDWPYDPEDSVSASYQALQDKSIDSEFNVLLEDIVNPNLFEVIPNIDSTGSRMIYDSLKLANNPDSGQLFITEKDSIAVNPTLFNFWKPFVPQNYQSEMVKIEEQLNVTYAGHAVPRIFRDETLNFFKHFLVSTSNETLSYQEQIISNLKSFPNPFTDQVNIQFKLKSKAIVDIKIYDFQGREIETLFSGKLVPDNYKIMWQPSNTLSFIDRGIYYCVITNNGLVTTLKLLKT